MRIEEKDGTITVIYSTVIRGMLGVASGGISAWIGQPTRWRTEISAFGRVLSSSDVRCYECSVRRTFKVCRLTGQR